MERPQKLVALGWETGGTPEKFGGAGEHPSQVSGNPAETMSVMNTKPEWTQGLKPPETPPAATIFPFQRRHLDQDRLKLPAIPPAAMHIIYDSTRPNLLPAAGTLNRPDPAPAPAPARTPAVPAAVKA